MNDLEPDLSKYEPVPFDLATVLSYAYRRVPRPDGRMQPTTRERFLAREVLLRQQEVHQLRAQIVRAHGALEEGDDAQACVGILSEAISREIPYPFGRSTADG